MSSCRIILCFPSLSLEFNREAISQGAPIPFSQEWYLEPRAWASARCTHGYDDGLIASKQVLSMQIENVCACTCVHTHTPLYPHLLKTNHVDQWLSTRELFVCLFVFAF